MRFAALIALGAPALAALVTAAIKDRRDAMGPALAPRAVAGAGLAAAVAGCLWLLGERERPLGDGLLIDRWRALLLIGIFASTAAWLIRRREAADVVAARLALSAALAGTVAAADGATAAAFVAASALSLTWLAVRGHVSGRAEAIVIATDVAFVVAVIAEGGTGLGTPMRIAGWAGWLLAASVATRMFAFVDARDEPGLALAFRLRSLWLLFWIDTGTTLRALQVVLVAGAVIYARRAARNASPDAVAVSSAALAGVAICSADADLASAAALLTAAAMVPSVLSALGRARNVLAGLAPAGAALPGVALLASHAFSASDLQGRVVALGIGVAICYLAAAVGSSFPVVRARARAGWALVPLATGVLIASAPSFVASVAPALRDAGAPLTDAQTTLPTWLLPGVIAALLAAGWATREQGEDPEPPLSVEAVWAPTRVRAAAAAAVFAAAIWALALGVSRGFL